MTEPPTFTAFSGQTLLATGTIETIAHAIASLETNPTVSIFEDATGAPAELDMRQGPGPAIAEYRTRTGKPSPPRPGRGRPKLGVVAREVTLLPRHWAWLAGQPGGASAALRRLVEEARRRADGPDRLRRDREAAYRVMAALAGDLPGFEEASRALFAGDRSRLQSLTTAWPTDIGTYVLQLAPGDETP